MTIWTYPHSEGQTTRGLRPRQAMGFARSRTRGKMNGRTALTCLAACLLACAGAPEPSRYRLAHSGEGWWTSGSDPVYGELGPRYPDFFEAVIDRNRSDDPPVGELRDDLEQDPVDRSNYDALNALAMGYFEMNLRGEEAREAGDVAFMSAGFRAAKIVAVPWRAYMEIEEPALRDAILDFFEDAASGEKKASTRTMGRLAPIVGSLVEHESDPARRARLEDLTATLEAAIPPLPGLDP